MQEFLQELEARLFDLKAQRFSYTQSHRDYTNGREAELHSIIDMLRERLAATQDADADLVMRVKP